MFAIHGTVVEARVVTDRETGRSRGFGFVTYDNAKDAENAVGALTGYDLHGREMRVDRSAPKGAGGRGGGRGGGDRFGGGGRGGGDRYGDRGGSDRYDDRRGGGGGGGYGRDRGKIYGWIRFCADSNGCAYR